MGGNGYVEEGPFARFYREAPLNSIWEGSGNVMCLDVLRALARVPAVRDALAGELRAARGTNRRYDAFVDALIADLARPDIDEGEARALTERIALAMQARLLIEGSPAAVADAFCASRLGSDGLGTHLRHTACGYRSCTAAGAGSSELDPGTARNGIRPEVRRKDRATCTPSSPVTTPRTTSSAICRR